MAVLKCKMCGGDLNIQEGVSVCECEYCGSRQTVPTADNEKKMNLFARANRLRFNCEFDKAAGIYESIVSEFPEEAEAYWGLLLCKYGIEYVDDPATGKKIPTCHRSSFESVMEDENFELACEYADATAKRVYREQAKEIEELRKGIIEVSSKEEPYDIFICYKETDENGDRTLDSVLAQDIYTALTEKGYRVFFSRITLEDKLGQEYEPYIFAALHSAKIMLAVGTDFEYYDAVWVKNEWSRYLQLIASGEKKTLIPCYKNLDAYDMPKEFARLQAQDMGKIGALQDLIRGIEKIICKEKNIKQSRYTSEKEGDSSSVALVKRAFLFLEDGNWEKAEEYCEKSLDADPENALAYVGKLMADLRVHKQSELNGVDNALGDYDNYKKAIRFAGDSLRNELEEYNKHIIDLKNDKTYENARKLLEEAKTATQAQKARTEFEKIVGYKDADEYVNKCEEYALELDFQNAKQALKEASTEAEFKKACGLLQKYVNRPEIEDFLSKERIEYQTRCDQARELWKNYSMKRAEYQDLSDKITKLWEKYSEACKNRDNLDSKAKKYQFEYNINQIKVEIYDEIMSKGEVLKQRDIIDSELNSKWLAVKQGRKELDSIKEDASRLETELNTLGFFARSKKKEILEKIEIMKKTINDKQTEYQNGIDHFIGCFIEYQKKETERQSRSVLEKCNTLENEIQDLKKEVDPRHIELEKMRKELLDPRFINILLSTSDKYIFFNVLQDYSLINQISRDQIELIKTNKNYRFVSNDVRAKIERNNSKGTPSSLANGLYF